MSGYWQEEWTEEYNWRIEGNRIIIAQRFDTEFVFSDGGNTVDIDVIDVFTRRSGSPFSLIGTWECSSGDMYEFRSDGIFTNNIEISDGRWRVEQDILILYLDSPFFYSLSGDNLQMMYENDPNVHLNLIRAR